NHLQFSQSEDTGGWLEAIEGWFGQLTSWSMEHLLSWLVLWQAVGLIVLAAAAYFLARPLRTIFERRVAELRRDSGPGRLARSALAHIYAIILLVSLWLAIGVLVQLDLSAGNDLLVVIASLLNAWVLIKLSSSIIANRLVANLIFVFAWSVAALNILGLLDALIATLDNVAIPFGNARLSLLSIVNGALLFAVLLWVALTLSRLIQNFIRGHSDISPRAQVLLGKVVRFTMITVAVVVALTSIGLNFAALAVFTGALGVGIGIGLQNQVSNLLSGLFLLLDKSIKPGDVIEVGTTFGWVKDMRARYVGVVTRDNKELLIPNDDFVTNQVINWSHSDLDVRMEVEFGVAYASDPHEIRKLAVEAAADASGRVVQSRRPVCHIKGFGDSSVDFVLRFWINDPQNGVTNIKGLVLLALWNKFKQHGVEIPYPHRHIVLDDPDAFR
ncbi:MAG: mechanosensitive ion channel, partial [Gammaproteobacteria bacterium]|nr:mechanosensitive ion channel [Gammaproteobacteria bacterium]